jgi:hypothetical protein
MIYSNNLQDQQEKQEGKFLLEINNEEIYLSVDDARELNQYLNDFFEEENSRKEKYKIINIYKKPYSVRYKPEDVEIIDATGLHLRTMR